MNSRLALILGSFFGFLSVALGAFGAHALKETLTPERLQWLDTGARYMMLHAITLVASFALGEKKIVQYARLCFVVGICVFGGALLGLAFTGQRWLGAIAPIGGTSLMVGWLCLCAYGVSLKRA